MDIGSLLASIGADVSELKKATAAASADLKKYKAETD